MLVALLQPAPETYKLFDDVLLLASGMVSRLNCMEPAQDGCLAALQSLRAAANWPGHVALGSVAVQVVISWASWALFSPTSISLPYFQVLYHGPREGVMPFFRSHLGFDCPARKGVADFLQEIALPSDQQVGRAWEQCILLVGPGWQKWQAHPQWRWLTRTAYSQRRMWVYGQRCLCFRIDDTELCCAAEVLGGQHPSLQVCHLPDHPHRLLGKRGQ